MLDKKTFLKYFNEIKKLDEKELRVSEFISKEFHDYGCISLYTNAIITMVDMLSQLMDLPIDDKTNPYYDNDISYFVFDLEFGRNPETCKDCIEWEDGRKFSIYSAEDLYDYLVLLKLEEESENGGNNEKKHNFH